MNKKFKVYNLGCKVNQYDGALLAKKLQKNGLKQVDKDADFVIINTCAVTHRAISKDKRMLNLAKKENPQAKTVLMGCWPQVYKDNLSDLDVDIIWGVGKQDELIKKISQTVNFKINDNIGNVLAQTDRSRYFLKIQDGCEQFCSYCIIPYTRGKLQSRAWQDIVEEAEQATRRGYKEIVLNGIHLGLYGREKDNKDKIDLAELLDKLLKIKNLGRIRLSSIEVVDLNNRLIDIITRNKQVCPHLHISLQSGSNKILKAMNRPYSKEFFQKKVDEIRNKVGDIAISTDIIVGFPGESDADFEETLSFAKEIAFSRIHVFSFSAHEKTPAYSMPKQLESTIIKKRSKALRDLALNLEQNFIKKMSDKELDVLIEKQTGDLYQGRTQFYFEVEFRKDRAESTNFAIGDIVKVKL